MLRGATGMVYACARGSMFVIFDFDNDLSLECAGIRLRQMAWRNDTEDFEYAGETVKFEGNCLAGLFTTCTLFRTIPVA